MKKISALAALTMAVLVLATPAHADDGGRDRGRLNIAGYSSGDLCRGALALVPFAAPWTGPAVNDACYDRDHNTQEQGSWVIMS